MRIKPDRWSGSSSRCARPVREGQLATPTSAWKPAPCCCAQALRWSLQSCAPAALALVPLTVAGCRRRHALQAAAGPGSSP